LDGAARATALIGTLAKRIESRSTSFMDALTRLNTLCPVCDGPIGFEAFRLGERASCPHCQETIALGSVAPLPSETSLLSAGLAPGRSRGLTILACAAALFLLIAGGFLVPRKAAVSTIQPASRNTDLAANSGNTLPLQAPVAPPPIAPAVLPPAPIPEDPREEQLRQLQAHLNQQELIAELRRANDIAEANARWQRLRDMESQAQMISQPVEIVEPTEIYQPIQPFQVIQTLPPPIRIYGGGIRNGGAGVYNFHPATGPLVHQYNAPVGWTTSPVTFGN
jgi:hypothetical protein